MSDIHRRIKNVEKKLKLNKSQEPDIIRTVICKTYENNPLGIPPEPPADVEDKKAWQAEWKEDLLASLGPVETWFTYKQRYEAAEKRNAEYMKNKSEQNPGIQIIEIKLDAGKELRARKQQKATKNNQKPKN